jgi:uncharacterized membrane protein
MVYPVHRVRRTAARSNEVQNSMMKTLTTFTAVAAVAAALLAAPTDANAQRRWGPAVGLGILGGVAAGAIVGSAIANSYGPAYVVQPGYVPYGAYGGPVPVGCPGGYWARVPVYDAYGNVVGWRGRPRFFCP